MCQYDAKKICSKRLIFEPVCFTVQCAVARPGYGGREARGPDQTGYNALLVMHHSYIVKFKETGI